MIIVMVVGRDHIKWNDSTHDEYDFCNDAGMVIIMAVMTLTAAW